MPSLDDLAELIRHVLDDIDTAREHALPASREIIRLSATAIKHVHRAEWAEARELLGQTGAAVRELRQKVDGQPAISSAGFVQDAQKEYAEAVLTYAFVRGEELPHPDDIGVEPAPYLNGIAEALGELRRYCLDSIRVGRLEEAERVLAAMDSIYYTLVTFDYPDAVSQGLRRRVDADRGILERTRGDLTNALRQSKLESAMARLEGTIESKG